MKKIRLMAIMAAAVLSLSMLTACGSKSDEASTASSSSTAAESSESSSEAVESSESSAESSEESSASSEEASSESSAESTAADSSSVSADFAVSYNGTELKLGDNINDKLSALGDPSKPSEKIKSCVAASDAMAYYYAGLTIETREDGVIYSFDIKESGSKTAKDIAVGSSTSDIDSAYSSYKWDISDTCYFYTDKEYTVQIDISGGSVTGFWIYSSALAMK